MTWYPLRVPSTFCLTYVVTTTVRAISENVAIPKYTVPLYNVNVPSYIHNDTVFVTKLLNASPALTALRAVPYLCSGTDFVITDRMTAMGSGTQMPAMVTRYN